MLRWSDSDTIADRCDDMLRWSDSDTVAARDVIFRKITNRNQTDTNEMTNTETKFQTNFYSAQKYQYLTKFYQDHSQNSDKIPRNTKKFGTEIPNTYRFGFGVFLVYQIFGYRLTSLVPALCDNAVRRSDSDTVAAQCDDTVRRSDSDTVAAQCDDTVRRSDSDTVAAQCDDTYGGHTRIL